MFARDKDTGLLNLLVGDFEYTRVRLKRARIAHDLISLDRSNDPRAGTLTPGVA